MPGSNVVTFQKQLVCCWHGVFFTSKSHVRNLLWSLIVYKKLTNKKKTLEVAVCTRVLICTMREKSYKKSFMYKLELELVNTKIFFFLYFLIAKLNFTLIAKLNFTLPAVRNTCIAMPCTCNRIISLNNNRNHTIQQTSTDHWPSRLHTTSIFWRYLHNQHIKINSFIRCENARERICNYNFFINSKIKILILTPKDMQCKCKKCIGMCQFTSSPLVIVQKIHWPHKTNLG